MSTSLFSSLLGWVATAMFVASYFFVRPVAMRATQMAGALLWIVYATRIDAYPVIVANALVIAAAGWTTLRELTRDARSERRIGSRLRL
jgi:hypothetical protein